MADGTITIDTDLNTKGAEKGVDTLKSKIGNGFKTIGSAAVKGVAVVTGALAALTKASIDQYATYEQAVGGVETLFKESSNIVMDYAKNAYKTAGLSANEYMETITSFSASLLQGLGGDTKKAAEIGNMAVTDMSDNVNKMGSNMEDVQHAYQGFAKQNYTMLDNLKLGYGGTKEEMQRLLQDAEKLTGIHYDINNFSDVIEAIHAVQDNIGITGTTAKEAEGTIEGSLNMTKAAWKNLLTGMADDGANFDTLIDNLVNSLTAFGKNIMPRIEIILNSTVKLIDNLFPIIANKIPELISSILPQLVDSGVKIIQALVSGVQQNLPTLVNSAMQIANSFITGITEMLPQLLQMGMQIIIQLGQGIAQQLPTLIPLATECIMNLINTFVINFPQMINVGIQLLDNLVNGLVEAIPRIIAQVPLIISTFVNGIITALPSIIDAGMKILDAMITGILDMLPNLIETVPKLISNFVNTLMSNLPKILEQGSNILLKLVDGIVNNIPKLIDAIPKIITGFINGVSNNLPKIIETGILIVGKLVVGLIQAIPQLIACIPQLTNAIIKGFRDVDWSQVGVNIVKGIWAGIKALAGWLISKVRGFAGGIVDGFKGALGIHSPSRVMRDMVGKFIPQGISVGIDKEMPTLEADTLANLKGLYNKMQNVINSDSLGIGNRSIGNSYINNIVNNTSPTIKNVFRAVLNVDGKDLAESIAPHQEVFDNYALGR